MLKLFCLNFLFFFCGAFVIQTPLKPQQFQPLENQEYDPNSRDLEQIQGKWGPHVMDFLNLLMTDADKLIKIVLKHIDDPDLVGVANFVFSKEFNNIVLEVEDTEEFKEALNYLQSKKYDVKPITELVNSLMNSQSSYDDDDGVQKTPEKHGKGIINFIEEIVRALPIEDMKKLFEKKLETNSDVADLYATLSSDDFIDIMKRFAENPKLLEIKKVFEDHGLDFDAMKLLFEDIFCHHSKKEAAKNYLRHIS